MTQTTTQTGSGTKPGQMTAVMRAMNQATGPKVLRVGVVQGGKVIEERIIKQRTHVTIGPSEKSMFVTPSKNVPPSFRLFELVGNEYALNFLEGMAGRVALKTGVSDLASLKSQAKKVSVGQVQAFQVPLSDDARGKIVVGDTTFLFQFVAAPPPQPKPQLPASVRGGFVQSIDWTTTIIAAFSFLLHFGAVGTIYSDWMDPLVNDEVDVAQILETVRSLPPPPPVEQPKETDTQPTPASTAPAEAPKPSAGASAAKGAGGGKISDTRAAAIANELNQLDMQMLGALNASGNATAGVLDRGDVPLGLLDNAAASGAGAGLGGIAGLNLGNAGGGTVRPGAAGGGGLANIGDTQAATAASSQGAAKTVKGPTGSANVGGAAVSGGNVANASSVVAGMAAGFRRCYNRGLQADPTMKGSVRITAKIGPNGEVLSASPSGGGGLSGDVISCVVARVQSAQFSPPEGGGATVVIPVSFVSQ
ncbi:AgmX/PglI C-terminal domain-containing protein [Polyangium jinanense]|uniref:AgmX/PglI C-terminal domain-containing protein n=1 Tax=Polyangium jinanense TaxID=2829994 RepID=A0A9X3X9A6_9BACT|nr:AgmX/PglI C-terminal domain-containing protein [Polyangium jinanense]MDC3959466.1 AgmX/PglI C-terminal domain-containing protein [Polyangium jinanense]MDC3984900.1 AgmX/PglI C-terminal domain-containing protein [Polyangium jinanense]